MTVASGLTVHDRLGTLARTVQARDARCGEMQVAQVVQQRECRLGAVVAGLLGAARRGAGIEVEPVAAALLGQAADVVPRPAVQRARHMEDLVLVAVAFAASSSRPASSASAVGLPQGGVELEAPAPRGRRRRARRRSAAPAPAAVTRWSSVRAPAGAVTEGPTLTAAGGGLEHRLLRHRVPLGDRQLVRALVAVGASQ